MKKNICTVVCAFVFLVGTSSVPRASAQTARTDVYHVHFAKASLGKAVEEANYLKQPDPNATMPGHYIVLRHQEGEDWDYAVIEHLGTSATIKASGTPAPAGARDLNAWHGDTFVNGPAWSEFAKAMGLDDAAKSAGSVYVVSVFRAAPGHRDELEKSLAQPTGPSVAGAVLMQHLEGGPWQFLTVQRYNSWQDFATDEKSSAADTLKPDGGWLAVRNYSSYHNDTITDRIFP